METARWYDEPNNIIVVLMDLPDKVDACVTPNEDGTHTVFVSSRLDQKGQWDAYQHELEHIRKNHFALASVGEAEIQCRDSNDCRTDTAR